MLGRVFLFPPNTAVLASQLSIFSKTLPPETKTSMWPFIMLRWGPSDTHKENVTKHYLMEMLVILLFLLGGREKPDVVPFISKPEHTSGNSENAWHPCWSHGASILN